MSWKKEKDEWLFEGGLKVNGLETDLSVIIFQHGSETGDYYAEAYLSHPELEEKSETINENGNISHYANPDTLDGAKERAKKFVEKHESKKDIKKVLNLE